MFEARFETAEAVLFVVVVIPRLMGFVLSIFGLGVVEWTRFCERRESKKPAVTKGRTMIGASSMMGADT